ncbi:MAG: metalloregulator ArsR/SmtB family transcription factor [Pseudomonadota bacterium]
MTYEDAIQHALVALSDPTRRKIFESLKSGSRSVADLAEHQPVSRPAVSQHLKVLETAGLVQVRPKGNRRLYSIKQDGLETLRTYLDGFWNDVLTAYAAEIEAKFSTEEEDEK